MLDLRVLLVEDDLDLADALSQVLISRGFQLTCCADGVEALALARRQRFEAILLDLSLPGIDGLELLRRLRDDDSHTPVLVVTARSAVGARVLGLNVGADDYLAKPFDIEELEARLRALIRRSHGDEELHCGTLRYEPGSGVFYKGPVPMRLSPREATLLKNLLAHRGHAIARDALHAQVFGADVPVSSAIEVLVHRLRKRLAGTAADLVTLRGVGYLLIDEAVAGMPE